MRAVILLLMATGSFAQDALLPPVAPFTGKSRALALAPDHEWATPFERSQLQRTPRYDETVAWLARLCKASPQLEMVEIGVSDEGRKIWMVVAGDVRNKPTLLAQGGIHPGEIDGKDAGMMLLRDMTVLKTKAHLLEHAALLFIPVIGVDGHEIFGPFNRVNQRGPLEMGWRTNGRNLNLNRDYAKLDTPGIRAAASVINKYRPALYFDIHVTDGSDYQYDITWGYSGAHAYSPAIATWMRDVLDPHLATGLRAQGHVPGPLVFSGDPAKGNSEYTFGCRFSNGWGDIRHLPTVLVENHSLKPFDQRVLGTYVLMESTLELLGKRGAELIEATATDRKARRDPLPLTWDEGTVRKVEFLGIERKTAPSAVSGGEKVIWTGVPWKREIDLAVHDKPGILVERPKRYWIPDAWAGVIVPLLKAHGIVVDTGEPREVAVSVYRVETYELGKAPFEGRLRVDKATFKQLRSTLQARHSVAADQPLGDLAMVLLEPESPDSLFRWGFFNSIFQRTEYIDNYVIEPLAEKMLAADPALKKAFEKRLAEDEAFAKDPRARRMWFYERTEYFDKRWRVIPIGRENR